MIHIAEMARAIVPTQIREVTKRAKPTTLHLGIGQPDLGFPDSVANALVEFSELGHAKYTPNPGSNECREAIANDVGCAPNEVLVTCGVQEAMALSIFGTVEPGDVVLVPDPGFPAYPNLVIAAGATPVAYTNWRWSPDEFSQLIDQHRPRAIILNDPGNPTGIVQAPETVETVARLCADNDVIMISDEIYEAFVFGDTRFRSPRDVSPEHVLKLSGLSKSHAIMGLRLGWIVAPSSVVDALTPLHQHLVTSAPSISQYVAIAALADTAGRDRIVNEMKARAGLATSLARELSVSLETRFIEPEGAFYLMLHLGDSVDDVAVAKSLLDTHDVLTIPGSGFGAQGSGFLRIAYTVEPDILSEAFARMQQFFAGNEI